MGAFAWAVTLLIRTADAYETELIERILLLGIFVIVPLGLSLVDSRSSLMRFVAIAASVGAVSAFVSLLLRHGSVAALLAVPWLLVTGVIGLMGLQRVSRSNLRGPAEVSISAALIYLPIGAVWFFAYRLGIQPMGFGETIVLLTAVHFHFAGFAAPLIAGLSARCASDRSVLSTIAVVGIISGTPLVAAGITASPLIALVGAVVISIGLLTLAGLTLVYVVPSLQSNAVRVLLVISALAVLPAMVLACVYAYSIVFKKLIIDIPQMAMTHGIANSFGFALCGLTGWAILSSSNLKDS